MAKVKLKIIGSFKLAGLSEGDIVNVENILEIIQRQRLLNNYNYDYTIFLNGVSVEDESKSLRDGDEVVLVPIVAGG